VTGVELELQGPVERENPLGSTATLSPEAVKQLFAGRATPFAPGAEAAPLTARVPQSPFAARRPEPDERTAVHPMMKTLTLDPDDARPIVVAEKAAPFAVGAASATAQARGPASPFAARRSDPDEQTAIHPLSTTEPLGPDEVKKILAEKVTPFAPVAAPPTRSFESPALVAVLAPAPAPSATSFATPALMAPIEPTVAAPSTSSATPALMAPIEPTVTPPATSFSTPPLTTPLRALAARSTPVRRSFAVSAGELSFGAHFLAAMEQARLNPNDERDGPAAD